MINLLSSIKSQTIWFFILIQRKTIREVLWETNLLERANYLFLAAELLFRLFMVLKARQVICEHPTVGQKDIVISTVWWSRDEGGKGRLAGRLRGRS